MNDNFLHIGTYLNAIVKYRYLISWFWNIMSSACLNREMANFSGICPSLGNYRDEILKA